MPRSRSRSRGRRSRTRSRTRSRSRSLSSGSVEEGTRVHVADLSVDSSRKEIERVMEKYGPINEVWLARNPPCFAFVNFRHREDAEECIRDFSGNLCGSRVRLSIALPRSRGRRSRRGYDPNLRCYTCGDRGHFSRDCDSQRRRGGGYGGRYYSSMGNERSPSPYYRRRNSRYSRSRSRSRDRPRRSRSASRERRSRSRSRKRSRKDSRRSRSRSTSAARNGEVV